MGQPGPPPPFPTWREQLQLLNSSVNMRGHRWRNDPQALTHQSKYHSRSWATATNRCSRQIQTHCPWDVCCLPLLNLLCGRCGLGVLGLWGCIETRMEATASSSWPLEARAAPAGRGRARGQQLPQLLPALLLILVGYEMSFLKTPNIEIWLQRTVCRPGHRAVLPFAASGPCQIPALANGRPEPAGAGHSGCFS